MWRDSACSALWVSVLKLDGSRLRSLPRSLSVLTAVTQLDLSSGSLVVRREDVLAPLGPLHGRVLLRPSQGLAGSICLAAALLTGRRCVLPTRAQHAGASA